VNDIELFPIFVQALEDEQCVQDAGSYWFLQQDHPAVQEAVDKYMLVLT